MLISITKICRLKAEKFSPREKFKKEDYIWREKLGL